MPLVLRYRKRKRTNNVRRPSTRRVRRKVMRRVPRTVGPPKQMFAKLRWTTVYNANVAPGASATREFRMNSLFDPDLTGVGDQPYYFDQYAAMFGRYRVYGCKMDIIGSCSSAASNLFHPVLTITSHGDTAPGWAFASVAQSAKRSIRKIIIPGQTNAKMSRYYDLRSIAGVSKTEYNNVEVYQAQTSANPNRSITLSVTFQNNDSSATIAWAFNLQLTFYVKFFDNVEPAGS